MPINVPKGKDHSSILRTFRVGWASNGENWWSYASEGTLESCTDVNVTCEKTIILPVSKKINIVCLIHCCQAHVWLARSFLPPLVKVNTGLSCFDGGEPPFFVAQHASGTSGGGDAGDAGSADSGVRLGESCRVAELRSDSTALGKLLPLGLLAVRLVLDGGVAAYRLAVWLCMQVKLRGEQEPGASLTAQLLELPESRGAPHGPSRAWG